MIAITSLLLALVPFVSAIVTPNTPDGSTVVNEGQTLNVAWAADDTGSWTNVTIQLMTGDNFQMVPLQTLATGVDGTTTTTFSTPAPDVEPNSKIYFLQFTNNGETEATWTTRFTIAGADGSTTEPEQATQSNGDAIPWGIGAVVGGDTSNSTTPSGVAGVSASASSALASTSTGSGVTNYQPSTTGSPIANPSNGSGPSRVSASVSSESASASDTAASASTSPNAAGKLAVGAGGIVGMAGIVFGLFL